MNKPMYFKRRAAEIEHIARNLAALPQSDPRDASIRKVLEHHLEAAYDAGQHELQSKYETLAVAARAAAGHVGMIGVESKRLRAELFAALGPAQAPEDKS